MYSASPSILLDTAGDDPEDPYLVKEEVPPCCLTLQVMIPTTHLEFRRKCLPTAGDDPNDPT
jgi:hypothetical protein